ncbi:MAG: glycosyltransferase family 39 protein [Alicyclobacillaceae bacterium]|nr:glycosyltransferase family 39 protein [Alicyclobacillaceae bacterium]
MENSSASFELPPARQDSGTEQRSWPARPAAARPVVRFFRRERLHRGLLGIILLLSAALNIWRLNSEGFGNTYYAAAVRSMLMNGHNLFFNAFDPNGFITIDKPPVGFWLQALSAWVFGFHGWALLLPQALAGIALVWVVHRMVRRHFGAGAALAAAAVMALTPIAVAVSRTNEVDTTLVLSMLLAADAMWKSIRTGRFRWLVLAGIIEGVAFNIKMMEAYLVLPAVYATYILVYRLNWRRKCLHLVGLSLVIGAVSFSWPVAVDLTPAQDRPWVGSTQTNSEIELIFGYNGIERLTGRAAPGRSPHAQAATLPSGESGQAFAGAANSPANGDDGSATPFPARLTRSRFRVGAAPDGGLFGGGSAGPLRLFRSDLAGQISWLLPFALLACVPLLRRVHWRRAMSPREAGTVFWLAWLLPMAAFFSVARFFHPYYMITMAPAIAALTGGGLARMWRGLSERGRWRWFLPCAAAFDLVFEWHLVRPYGRLGTALIGVGAGLALASIALACSAVRARRRPDGEAATVRARRSLAGASVLGTAALVAAPGYWALTPVLYGVNETIPSAGPPLAVTRAAAFGVRRGFDGGFGPTGTVGGIPGLAAADSTLRALETYLIRHRSPIRGSYLVATVNAQMAAPIILDTGLPVMAMGGFTGSDPALSVSRLAELTRQGVLKYFLVPSSGRLAFDGGQSAVLQWIQAHCTAVPDSAWLPSATVAGTGETAAPPFGTTAQAGFVTRRARFPAGRFSGRWNLGGWRLYVYAGR